MLGGAVGGFRKSKEAGGELDAAKKRYIDFQGNKNRTSTGKPVRSYFYSINTAGGAGNRL